jgi:hypothetical protein
MEKIRQDTSPNALRGIEICESRVNEELTFISNTNNNNYTLTTTATFSGTNGGGISGSTTGTLTINTGTISNLTTIQITDGAGNTSLRFGASNGSIGVNFNATFTQGTAGPIRLFNPQAFTSSKTLRLGSSSLFIGSNITTTGSQTYTGDLFVNGTATLDSGNANQTFNGRINAGKIIETTPTIDSFYSDGTFNPDGINKVDVLVVGGGGGGANQYGGGGGGGQVKEQMNVSVSGPVNVVVGAGGAGAGSGPGTVFLSGTNGSFSSFGSITANGGLGGAAFGGNGGNSKSSAGTIYNGGTGAGDGNAGGGGAGTGGAGYNASGQTGGNGGNGVTSVITGDTYGGGGGGGALNAGGTGGSGGGNGGAYNGGSSSVGLVNTGGGGGGGYTNNFQYYGRSGGSGLVAVRYYALVTSGYLSINAGTGSVNFGNSVGSVTPMNQLNINASNIQLPSINATEINVLSSAGAITQASGSNLVVTSLANFVASGNAITLTSFTNDFQTVLANGTAVSINEINFIDLGAITATQGLTVNGNNTTGDISLGGPISVNGSANVSLSGRNVSVFGNILAESGNIFIYGNGGGVSQIGDYSGVYIFRAQVSTTNGNLVINGLAGSDNWSGHGIVIDDANVSAGGTGTISLTGVTGTGYGDHYHGIALFGNARISTNNGNIEACGVSNGTGDNSSGIYSDSGNISIGGTGSGRFIGRAGADTNFWRSGIDLFNSAVISTNNGNIILDGTSNSSNSDVQVGVLVRVSSKILVGGNGSANIVGLGGTGTGLFHFGFGLESGSCLTTNNGDILINGVTGGTGDNNRGIQIDGANITAGGIGQILMNGTSGNGTSVGVLGVRVFNSTVATTNGPISISGTTLGSSNLASGILVDSNSTIFANGSLGTIELRGDSANSSIQIINVSNGTVKTTGGLIRISSNSLNIDTTGFVNSTLSGDVIIQTLGAGIDLGNGTDTTSNLGLSQTELNRITAGTLTIGNSITGPIVNTAPIDRTNATLGTNLTLISSGSITQAGGNLTVSGTANLVSSGSGSSGNITLNNATNNFTTVRACGTNINIIDSSNITLGAINSAGIVSISATNILITQNISTSGGDQTFIGNLVLGANMTLATGNGNLSVTGKIDGGYAQSNTYAYQNYTNPGSSSWIVPNFVTSVDVLVVAGGGAGGSGGGGGGQVQEQFGYSVNGTVSITTANGGIATNGQSGGMGGNSTFGSLTSIGGSGGGWFFNAGLSNGWTGGGAGGGGGGVSGGLGIGNLKGGDASSGSVNAGGGAGASANGTNGSSSGPGNGGSGILSSITGLRYGGGGGGYGFFGGSGTDGGGNGGRGASTDPSPGLANRGGGGGGGNPAGPHPASGGSGIVVIRYYPWYYTANLYLNAGTGFISLGDSIGGDSYLDSLTITAANISLPNVNATTLTINATNGPITQAAGTNLTISGTANFVSRGAGDNGNITLNNSTNNFYSTGSISCFGTKVIIVNNNATVMGSSNISGCLSINSPAGSITQLSGSTIVVSGPANFVATSNSISLTSPTNNFNIFNASGSDIAANDTNTISLGSIAASGNLTINAANITLISNISTTGGSQTYNGNVIVNGNISINTGNGNLTINGKIDAGCVTSGSTVSTFSNFTSSGTFTTPAYVTQVDVLVVGGGGGGGDNYGGGGGGGQVIEQIGYSVLGSISVSVGAGGSRGIIGQNGGSSAFGSLSALGGGGADSGTRSGGISYNSTSTIMYGGNSGSVPTSGGGAGTTANGTNGSGAFPNNGGNGGAGFSSVITGLTYGGGGGGYGATNGGSGTDGGGNGGKVLLSGASGLPNRGGGGGGGYNDSTFPPYLAGNGGSGFVAVRYDLPILVRSGNLSINSGSGVLTIGGSIGSTSYMDVLSITASNVNLPTVNTTSLSVISISGPITQSVPFQRKWHKSGLKLSE